MSEAIVKLMQTDLSDYDYELLFIDNCSTDGTRDLLRQICAGNKKIKAIFNVTNFGQFNSPFYGMCQTTGDCTISMCCDFQDPVELLVRFVDEWERGAAIVCGIKTASRENKLMRFFRTIKNISSASMEELEQAPGMTHPAALNVYNYFHEED